MNLTGPADAAWNAALAKALAKQSYVQTTQYTGKPV